MSHVASRILAFRIARQRIWPRASVHGRIAHQRCAPASTIGTAHHASAPRAARVTHHALLIAERLVSRIDVPRVSASRINASSAAHFAHQHCASASTMGVANRVSAHHASPLAHHTLTIAVLLELPSVHYALRMAHGALRMAHGVWRTAPTRALHRASAQLPAAYQKRQRQQPERLRSQERATTPILQRCMHFEPATATHCCVSDHHRWCVRLV
jgi:hypothetical protein